MHPAIDMRPDNVSRHGDGSSAVTASGVTNNGGRESLLNFLAFNGLVSLNRVI